MYTLTVAEAEGRFSHVLAHARAGEEVEILCEDGAAIKVVLESPVRHKTAGMYEGEISMSGRFDSLD